jgi:toxin ParE1/3/4
MVKIIWSPDALEDIELIAEYISRDSPNRASKFVEKLVLSTDRLIEFPFSGRIIPELNDENRREIIIDQYRIMYEYKNNEVWITAVFHSSKGV